MILGIILFAIGLFIISDLLLKGQEKEIRPPLEKPSIIPNGTLVRFMYPYERPRLGVVLESKKVSSSLVPDYMLLEYCILTTAGRRIAVYSNLVEEVK